MRPGDLHRAGPEGRVGVVIGNDRDQAALILWPHGNFTKFPDDWRIAFIRWVNSHRAIAQHGFGPRRGDGNVIARFAQGHGPVCVFLNIFIGFPPGQRVLEMPHVARHLDILDLQIGNRRFEMRVPVHQPLAAIDQRVGVPVFVFVIVHIHEDLDHRVVEIRRVFVALAGIPRRTGHREGVAFPVTTRADALQLFDDVPGSAFLIAPSIVKKGFATHFATASIAVRGKFFLDRKLQGDARMVLTRLPKRVVAFHPVPADQDILQRVVEGVTDVERAVDVGRRDHDGKGRMAWLGIGPRPERPRLFPGGINPRFGFRRVKGLFHRHLLHPASLVVSTPRGAEGKASFRVGAGLAPPGQGHRHGRPASACTKVATTSAA